MTEKLPKLDEDTEEESGAMSARGERKSPLRKEKSAALRADHGRNNSLPTGSVSGRKSPSNRDKEKKKLIDGEGSISKDEIPKSPRGQE